MSKEQALKTSLASFSWFYRWRMFTNIENALGLGMLEKVVKRAEIYWQWSNHYANKWSKS